MNLDDLELELRKLAGVRAAGFTDRDDVLLIQLQVSGGDPPPNLTLQATRIAYRHSDKPVALEVVRWRVAPEGRDQPAIAAPIDGALSSRAGIAPIDQEHAPPAPLPSGLDDEPTPSFEADEPEPPELLDADEPPVDEEPPVPEPTPTLDETVVDAPPELVDEPPIAPAEPAPVAPAQPTIAVAARRSSRRAAATPRQSPTTTTTPAATSHRPLRRCPGSTRRDTTPSNELLALSSTRPMRSELKISSVQ